MLDFSPIWAKTRSLGQIMEEQTLDDLRRLAGETYDAIERAMANCVDADITFVPDDPAANDSDEGKGWTLGHIIAHVTAGAEETSFLAAEMARGIPHHGRSRYEVPWETLTTVAQCSARLRESRRMRLATLDLWPDEPHLDVTHEMAFLGEHVNAKGYFGLGLMHDGMHLGYLESVVRQAAAARGA